MDNLTIDQQKVFCDLIKSDFEPVLHKLGFSGGGAHFRRLRAPFIDCVHIHNIRGSGDDFYVDLGVHLTFLPNGAGMPPDPKTMTESECQLRRRLHEPGEHDHPFKIGKTEAEARASVAEMIALYNKIGEVFFQHYFDVPGAFIAITPERISTGRFSPDLLPLTRSHAALFLARVYSFAGDAEKARQFARTGLAIPDATHTLEPAFKEILAKHP